MLLFYLQIQTENIEEKIAHKVFLKSYGLDLKKKNQVNSKY